MAKIAINGFGRIGRIFFRQAFGHKDIEIVAINDLGDIDNLAYLLQYDSVYRKFEKKVEVKNGNIVVDGHEIKILQIKEADLLPWKELGIDIVLESTGAFESFEKAKVHLDAGAKKTVITAPSKDADGSFGQTVLMGINEGELKSWNLTSNGSCTTNATSPVVQIMTETIGVEKAVLNTVHAYTATQSIVDGPVRGGKDFRRGRAAAQNMSPSTTGAAIALGRVIKEINGKFDGIAIRVPIVAGSIADITFLSKKKTTVEEVNSILERAAGSPRWSGILKTTRDQVVSSDILGEPYGAIIDLNFTKVVDGDLVKILSWYDNEWGYVATLIKHIEGVARLV
ncbi:MAG: type I glyceraldehyde-3-phosphate dehydrogenase [Candidatus Pacebacteria bacterium]|nr:type I glyceraldehyde-3-phosphate dehydrogenase [Candidatus Paceibacterota bacterium]